MTVPLPDRRRKAITRDAIGIGIACGAYAISFGALSVASGLSVLQTQALSILMFTGASQLALIGVLAAGGGLIVAVSTAALLGTRNSFYALHMNRTLRVTGWRRLLAAQATIDESTGMSIGHEDDPEASRYAFWATAASVFILWNLGTLLGSLGAGLLGDPATYGLDAAIPAAFLALLWPRMRTPGLRIIALASAAAAVALSQVLPPGQPVLVAGAIGVTVGILLGVGRNDSAADMENPEEAP